MQRSFNLPSSLKPWAVEISFPYFFFCFFFLFWMSIEAYAVNIYFPASGFEKQILLAFHAYAMLMRSPPG